MKLYEKQVNISAYQIIIILLICRCQSFMISIYLRDLLEVKNSNIFISMLLSLIFSLIVFLPALFLIKKFKYANIIDISQKIFPKIGKLISLIFSIYFLLMAIAHITNTDFFMMSYVYVDSAPFLVIGIVAVAIYALFLGIESIFRSGTIMFTIFIVINFIIILLLISTYNTQNFGPFILSDKKSIINDSSTLAFCSELVAMLILCEYCQNKTLFVFNIFQICSFIFEVILMLTIVLCLGYYTNSNIFPLYIISSVIEIPLFERSEAFYIVIDTLLSVIKTSIYLFLSSKCISPFVKQKYYKFSIFIIGSISFITSMFLIYNIQTLKSLIAFINSPLVILFLIVIIPLILIISNKIKNSLALQKTVKNQ